MISFEMLSPPSRRLLLFHFVLSLSTGLRKNTGSSFTNLGGYRKGGYIYYVLCFTQFNIRDWKFVLNDSEN